MEVMLFSKHLQGVPLDDVAPRVRETGIATLDLTVRPGGHVEPSRVDDDLPRCVETLARHGIAVGMISTEITDARDPIAERVLHAAASAGVRHYKLGYYRYGGFGTMQVQRAEVVARLRDLADLNASLGLLAGFHNHSGDFFGANVYDVAGVLEAIDPQSVGAYFDAAHATIEGGRQGWLMGLEAIASRIVMVAVKDFRWADEPGRAGVGGQRVEWCSLARGATPWPRVVEILDRIGFDGPTSFHGEYRDLLYAGERGVPAVLGRMRRDVAHFRDLRGAPLDRDAG